MRSRLPEPPRSEDIVGSARSPGRCLLRVMPVVLGCLYVLGGVLAQRY